MNRHGRPGQVWYQNHSTSRTGMQVIEGAKTGNVPFGFSRALVEENDPVELEEIYKVLGGCYGKVDA